MKRLLFLLPLVALVGCVKPITQWGHPTRYDAPLSLEQQRLIADHVQKILAATPRSLAGDDQDWDDAIEQAHREARSLYSPLVQFEYHRDGGFFLTTGSFTQTGRWRYVAQPSVEGPAP